MKINTKLRTAGAVLTSTIGLLWLAGTQAQVLDSTIQAESRINTQAQASQERIDGLADQTGQLLTEYRKVVSETESLKIYNDQLEKIVNNQREELTSIDRQLAELENTNREVVPLMLEMVDALDRMVESDVPFRLEERRTRVLDMRDLLDSSEVTTSEKYRRLIELYQGELEYGRRTEAYRGDLPDGQTVDFLRVGRTLLLYQSLDGSITGWWNPNTRQFEQVGDEYRRTVADGLAIAGNQRAPDLVRLPVPAPVAAQ
jgi:regulator of replication initiation timing